MHPFSPMLFHSVLNHCYPTTIWFTPLFAVPFHCPRLPWGLRECWQQKYFFDLNHSMGTQEVNMSDLGSTLFSPETTFDEAVGLLLGCWYSSLALHYYQLIYQIFKTVDLYQNNVLEHSVRAKTDDNVIDDFADVFGSESLTCFDARLSYKLTAAHQCSIV